MGSDFFACPFMHLGKVWNQHSYCQRLRKSACKYGWLDVKMNRYCLSNFLLKIAGCYLIVGGGEGEIKWIKAHSSRLHCHHSLLLSGNEFCHSNWKVFGEAFDWRGRTVREEKSLALFHTNSFLWLKKVRKCNFFLPKVLKKSGNMKKMWNLFNSEKWSKLWNHHIVIVIVQ